MDSHGSFFGQPATSARVDAGDGADLAASGSSGSVSGRRVCRTRLVITSVASRAMVFRASPRLRRLWHSGLKR